MDSRTRETRARVKITPREKRRQAVGWGGAIPEEKWGTTRRLKKKHIAIDEKTMSDIFKILAILKKSFCRFLSRISV